ncbi:hypothetical protein Tco_0257901 [Tanacetum coccineum]
MANLSSADPVYDEASPPYDSDILSDVLDKDNYQDVVCAIMKSSLMCLVAIKPKIPSSECFIVDNSLTAELVTYKEQGELYERRAKFELTIREQKIDE